MTARVADRGGASIAPYRQTGRAGEPPDEINAAAILAIVRHPLPAAERGRLSVDGDLDLVIRVPIEAFSARLGAIVGGALDASARHTVAVVVVRHGSKAQFTIVSDGATASITAPISEWRGGGT